MNDSQNRTAGSAAAAGHTTVREALSGKQQGLRAAGCLSLRRARRPTPRTFKGQAQRTDPESVPAQQQAAGREGRAGPQQVRSPAAGSGQGAGLGAHRPASGFPAAAPDRENVRRADPGGTLPRPEPPWTPAGVRELSCAGPAPTFGFRAAQLREIPSGPRGGDPVCGPRLPGATRARRPGPGPDPRRRPHLRQRPQPTPDPRPPQLHSPTVAARPELRARPAAAAAADPPPEPA